MLTYLDSFQCEWQKKRHTVASWLTLTGGLLIPLIFLINFVTDTANARTFNTSPHPWDHLYAISWRFMGMFLLPLGLILATSLVTQLEFRNNTWKQWQTTPQTGTTIFLAKLGVMLVMLIQFFLLFNIGIYLSAAIPALFFHDVPYPKDPFPFEQLAKINGYFFLDCLPIVLFQYLLGLQFRNFLVPLGVGLGLYVASMMALQWRHGYTIPYAYCAFKAIGLRKFSKDINLHYWALGWTSLFGLLGYILYITKKEKG